jgi:hypothetical protein
MFVLIGSNAVKYHVEKQNKNNIFCFDENTDIDIITKEVLNNYNELDLVESTTNLLILDYINKYSDTQDIVQINNIFFKVAPIEILLAIYSSHIIRIIPYSNSTQSVNISKWYRYLDNYLMLRNISNYKYYDSIFYGELTEFENTEQNLLLRKIFNDRFEETIEKFGDTDIDLENKTSDVFFKDSVLRYIEHDRLHLIINDEKEPIYKRVLSESNVSLDKNKFDNLNREEKTEMIKQELMVLIFERNIIMMLVNFSNCHSTMADNVTGAKNNNEIDNNKLMSKSISKSMFDILIDTCEKSLKDIFCHFATNLCGKLHYFLRRYVISHGNDFTNPKLYNFKKYLEKILEELEIQVDGFDSNNLMNANSELDLWKNYLVKSNTKKTLSMINEKQFNKNDNFSSNCLFCGNISDKTFRNKINLTYRLEEKFMEKLYSGILESTMSNDTTYKNNKVLIYDNNDETTNHINIIFYFITGKNIGKGFVINFTNKQNCTVPDIKYFIQDVSIDKNSYISYDRIDIINNNISKHINSKEIKKEIIEKRIKQKPTYDKYYNVYKYSCWCYRSGCTDLSYSHEHSPYEKKILKHKVVNNKPDIIESLVYLNYSGTYDIFTELCKILSSKILSVSVYNDDKNFTDKINYINNLKGYESDNSNYSDDSDKSDNSNYSDDSDKSDNSGKSYYEYFNDW